VKIKILFDKQAIHSNLNTGWGISFLVGENTLFDTGEKGKWLIENMKRLKVDITKIENIVISHDHWDHTGGLWRLLELNNRANLYITPGFSTEFKEKAKKFGINIIECKKSCKINERIFTTGEFMTAYKGYALVEQSLVIRENNKISVLTGCSHPGIVRILQKVKEDFENDNFHLVMGGFHLLNEEEIEIIEVVSQLEEFEIDRIGPTHCTGEEAEEIIKNKFGEKFFEVKVGDVVEI